MTNLCFITKTLLYSQNYGLFLIFLWSPLISSSNSFENNIHSKIIRKKKFNKTFLNTVELNQKGT